MARIFILALLLLMPSLAWAQAPPLLVRTNDGATVCQPSYAVAVNDGSLSCGEVSGLPAAIINMGTPTATTPWSQVTAGANANTLTMGAAGTLRPGTGTIEANEFLPGSITAASQMYMSPAAGSMAVVTMLSCNALTEKLRWSGTAWECVTDQGGVTAGQVAVTGADTTPNYLNSKLVAGTNITATVLNPGANEQLQLDVAASSNWADLVPGTNTTSGFFTFDGTANLRVNSQLRIPDSTTAPAVGQELKIDTDGDGTVITQASLTFRSGVTNLSAVSTDAPPTADGDVATYSSAQNKVVWAQPPGVGSGAPGGPINSLQSNLDNANFFGSPRWGLDPVTGELVGTCNRGVSGDCAQTLTSEAGPVAAPAGTNEYEVYIKQTGTVYESCWIGNGDTGERCVDGSAVGGVVDYKLVEFDMASCIAAGSANSNWDYDPDGAVGAPTAACETAGVIAEGVLQFPDGASPVRHCVQRKVPLAAEYDAARALSAVINIEATPTTGVSRWTFATVCRGDNETRASKAAWNTAVTTDITVSGTADGLVDGTFASVDKTGCDASEDMYIRLCRENNDAADTLTATVNVMTFLMRYGLQ